MSDHLSFLRAARANPADDLPRLVYADWLDERGDPRGEFVRVQLELEPRRHELHDPHVRDLLDREEALLEAHRSEWLGPAADLDGSQRLLGTVFVRGLPERLVLSLADLHRRGAEVFAALPSVRELAVYDFQGHGFGLGHCELLGNLDVLELADWPTETDCRDLCRSPYFGCQSVVRVWATFDCTPYSPALYIDPSQWRPRGRLEVVHLAGPWRQVAQLTSSLGNVWGHPWGQPSVLYALPTQGPFWHLGRHGFPVLGDRAPVWTGNWTRKHRAGSGPKLVMQAAEGVVVVPVYAHGDSGEGEYVRMSGDPAEEMRRDYQWEPAPVWVGPRRFRLGNREFGVRAWPAPFREYFVRPFDPPADYPESAWRQRGRDVKLWLDRGACLIDAPVGTVAADRRGWVYGG